MRKVRRIEIKSVKYLIRIHRVIILSEHSTILGIHFFFLNLVSRI